MTFVCLFCVRFFHVRAWDSHVSAVFLAITTETAQYIRDVRDHSTILFLSHNIKTSETRSAEYWDSLTLFVLFCTFLKSTSSWRFFGTRARDSRVSVVVQAAKTEITKFSRRSYMPSLDHIIFVSWHQHERNTFSCVLEYVDQNRIASVGSSKSSSSYWNSYCSSQAVFACHSSTHHLHGLFVWDHTRDSRHTHCPFLPRQNKQSLLSD